jgi:ABC-type spermidine/putrescine transport system permease subunit II
VHLLAAVPYVALVMSSVYANLDLRLEDQARTLGPARCRCCCA